MKTRQRTDILQHLGRNLAVELGPRYITSNIIAPGFFPSKLAQGLISNLGGIDGLSQDNPLRRLGEPDDIAGVAVFLCSPAGKYVYVLNPYLSREVKKLTTSRNGVEVAVDGGARLSAGRLSKL